MKLKTQDGRTLELNRDFRLRTWTGHSVSENALSITLETEPVKVASKVRYTTDSGELREQETFYQRRGTVLDTVIGYFDTDSSRNKVAKMLDDAWKNGADEFVVPQDNLAKSDVELFEDFCEKHGLTCVSINELGYTPQDTARNAKIWKTTSDFERRNILVAADNCDINDFGGAYSVSFKKWQALQPA